MKTEPIDKISKKQKETIEDLARKGCSISEVGMALGLSQHQMASIHEDERHPFNVAYWNAKIEYTSRLRDFAMNMAEHCADSSVRARIVEYLVTENSKAFENKRQHTSYTNIKKLLSLVRQQFVDDDGNSTIVVASAALRQKRLQQSKEVPLE